MPPTIDWMEMYLLSASVDVDEKNATSFLKARNSKIMCRTDTTIVAAVVTSSWSCQSYDCVIDSISTTSADAKQSSVGKGCTRAII
jgi:hypothetical protein